MQLCDKKCVLEPGTHISNIFVLFLKVDWTGKKKLRNSKYTKKGPFFRQPINQYSTIWKIYSIFEFSFQYTSTRLYIMKSLPHVCPPPESALYARGGGHCAPMEICLHCKIICCIGEFLANLTKKDKNLVCPST